MKRGREVIMYKKQMSLQRIVCLLSIIASAVVFIYSLGMMTDLFDMLYNMIPDPEDLDTARVAGARIYYDMQGFNRTLLRGSIGLILLSGTFMAVGLLCATVSKSQIVCFICGALSCFVLYWVLLQDHYSALSRGVLDLRDVCFFATIAVIAIIGAIFTINKLTRK